MNQDTNRHRLDPDGGNYLEHAESASISHFTTNQTPVGIYLDNGKRIGEVMDGVFRKHIKASIHLLRKPRALALSEDTLDAAERAGAISVEVEDVESGRIYRASIKTIRHHGFAIQRAGFEKQIALPLGLWSTDRHEDTCAQPRLL